MNARSNIFPTFDDEGPSLRIPPHSIEAETSVLGGLLLDNRAWDRVGDVLIEKDFYRHEHQLIFSTARELLTANRPVDVVTVFERLESVGKAGEIGGMVYLNALAQYVPSATNISRYAEIVRERSLLRQMVAAGDEIATAAFNTEGKAVEALIDQAQQKIFSLGDSRSTAQDDWQAAEEGVVEFFDNLQRQLDGHDEGVISTGLRDLDEKFDGGLRPGELVIIGARPSMGKTALALTIGMNAAAAGHFCGMLSMEMPKHEVQNRQFSMISHVHLSKVKVAKRLNDFDWSALSAAGEKVRKLPFYTTDKGSLNINQVRGMARKLKRRHGLKLLLVDYLGLMEGTDRKANRTTQLEEATRGLKMLAKELEIPIVLLAQLNREVEKRPDQEPILSDLRDCGAIEQDADIVMFVHRPFHVKPDLGPGWRYYAKLIVAKQRNGSTGRLDLRYVGENTHFLDWEGDLPTSMVRTKGGDL